MKPPPPPPPASQNNTLYSIVPLGCVLASFLSGEVGGGRDEASRAPEAVKMRGSLWPSAASIVCCRPVGVMTGSELSGAFSVRAGVLLTSCGGSTYHLVIFSPWLSPAARNSTSEWCFSSDRTAPMNVVSLATEQHNTDDAVFLETEHH